MSEAVAAKSDIRDLSFQECAAYLREIGEKPFRASQIFDWIYKNGAEGFDSMVNLPLGLRQRLKDDFSFGGCLLARKDIAADETTKFLFNLCDNEKVETVLIPARERTTLCVSTQAGCKFRCGFCASGIAGWSRNLSCSEITGQILYVKNHTPLRGPSHIVFMGIGEPLDNYDNLLRAIRLINSPKAINIAARRITISTCGVIPKIKALMQEGLQIELAVSLHGPNNQIRDILMPVNKRYPLKELIAACREYARATKRQITFEYILIKNLTCTEKAAEELGILLKGMLCKLNLIPYNPVAEFPHQPPAKMEMLFFKKKLSDCGLHATIRMPRGRDITAACGQLRHSSR